MPSAHPRLEKLARGWRVLGLLGHIDAIFNHVSSSWLDEHQTYWMAINPGDKFAADVVATDFQSISVDAVALPPGSNVNIDGFELHREIHKRRGAPGVALHTHSPYVAAVSAMECGLLPISQAALEFVNEIRYLRYDGLFRNGAFSQHMVDFARASGVAMLRNHGTLVVCSTIEEAVYLAYYLEEACRIQCLAQASGSALIEPPSEVIRDAEKSLASDRPILAEIFFDALCKRLGV